MKFKMAYTLQTCSEFSYKLYDPAIPLQGMITYAHKPLKQPKDTSIAELKNKLWYAHAIEYLLSN